MQSCGSFGLKIPYLITDSKCVDVDMNLDQGIILMKMKRWNWSLKIDLNRQLSFL